MKTILEHLSPQQRNEVRLINRIVSGNGKYESVEERDSSIDKLKNHLSDIVLSIILKEDRDKQEHFLISK